MVHSRDLFHPLADEILPDIFIGFVQSFPGISGDFNQSKHTPYVVLMNAIDIEDFDSILGFSIH